MGDLMAGLLALINAATAQAVFAIAVLGTYSAYVSPLSLDSLTCLGNSHFRTIGLGRGQIQAWPILPRPFLKTGILGRNCLHELHDLYPMLRSSPHVCPD